MHRFIVRVISLFALVIASMLLVAGCSPVETACPAIGYSSTLSIQLIGDSSQVSEITVCGGSNCVGEEALQESMRSGYAVQAQQDQDTWTATLFFPEEPLTLLATDSTGEVLFETQIHPEWVRTGGSEECGGPMSAKVAMEL